MTAAVPKGAGAGKPDVNLGIEVIFDYNPDRETP